MIRDLTELSVNMVKAEKTELVQEKAEGMAEEKILDILIPPVRTPSKPVVKTTGENENEEVDESVRNEKTREWMREKLKKGELDEKMIEFDTTASAIGMQVVGPFGMDDMGMNIQDIIGNMMPKKKKKRKTSIKEARKVIAHEEAQKLIDMDNVQKEALRRVEEAGIIFLDEIDKVAGGSKGGHGGPDVSREGVQRDLLPIVEGSTVNTKYGPVKTDHILFLASGAFHVSKPSDLIPELQGRFPIRVELKSLTEEDFIQILTIPENALLKQYAALLETENVKISFEDEAIREIAKTATIVNEEVENIGARRLHTILTTLLEDILFDVPDKMPESEIKITGKMVNDKLDTIVKNRDLSKYIL
jgi:ATP-dependent HslUV protease ATP-binding subunit HslU